ncbi:MFS transporter [Corynebacterium sp. sy039]|uniref:MFS transporter n=1 Tax=Corynebacterium sp. sy039 TaxID=2599641 RepID=UPI0011B73A1C|nr:MFS transporter [Corynebacterium sp. sy039]QDZ41818.1 MFS transporter [Corynebacterium sp. sy039]
MSSRTPGKTIWALSLATFINRSTGFLGLFAAIFFSSTGMNQQTIVIALFIAGIAGIVGSILGGRLADVWGKNTVLIVSTAVNICLFFLLGVVDYSRTWWVIAISAASILLSQAFVGPASALVAESAKPEERVTRFAFYRIFVNVGSIVAPALVGLIGRDHFHTLFFISALSSLIVPVILYAGRDTQDTSHKTESQGSPEGGETSSAIHSESGFTKHMSLALTLVLVTMACTMVIYAQHQSAVPLRLDTFSGGVQLYSLLLIINPVIVIAVEYPLSHLIKRLAANTALMLGVFIMAVGVAVTGYFAENMALAIFGWVLFSLGECIFAPMSNTYVSQLASDATQSAAQGKLAAFQSGGAALGPSIGSWMFFNTHDGVWLGCVALSIVSVVLIRIAGGLAQSQRA